jgi:hypothetical protein
VSLQVLQLLASDLTRVYVRSGGCAVVCDVRALRGGGDSQDHLLDDCD